MRKLLGIVVLLIGIAGLTLWGRDDFADEVESKIASAAGAVMAQQASEMTVDISGRDITLAGISDSEEQRDTTLVALQNIEGVRAVIDDVFVTPTVSPFTFTLERKNGVETLAGYRPDDGSFADVLGSSASALSVAKGQPDAAWVEAVALGVEQLRALGDGRLEVTDRRLKLQSADVKVATFLAAETALAALPNGYVAELDIEIEPKSPYTFTVVKSEAGLAASGEVPTEAIRDNFAQFIGAEQAAKLGLEYGMPSHNWPEIAARGTQALQFLEQGELSLIDTAVFLRGVPKDPGSEAGIMALFNDIPEAFSLNLELQAPSVSPYVFAASKNSSGVTANGYAPDLASLDTIKRSFETLSNDSDITVANGAPNQDWTAAIGIGALALNILDEAAFSLTDTAFSLSGIADSPTRADEVTALLGSLPKSFAADISLNVIPVSPFQITGRKVEGKTVLTGYIPNADARSLLAGISENVVVSELQIANGVPDQSWTDVAGVAAEALTKADTGSFDLTDRVLSFKSVNETPETTNDVTALLSKLPDGYNAALDVTAKPVVPYVFSAQKSEEGLSLRGYAPDAQTRESFASLADAGVDVKLGAGVPDANWGATVRMALEALNATETGELSVDDRGITITGAVFNPEARSQLQRMLNDLPDGYSAAFNLTTLDDGKPANLTLDYGETTGLVVAGKAPKGVTIAALSDVLGQTVRDAGLKESILDGGDGVLDTLSALPSILPDLEGFSLSLSPETSGFSGTLMPGKDPDEVGSALVAMLGTGQSVSLSKSAREPKEGEERTNLDTGKTEVYSDGEWIEVIEFQASVETCQTATAQILQNRKLNFLSGSAKLDRDSEILINQLASVFKNCQTDPNLVVEIGGHTDSVGSAALNADLSLKRATAVGIALVERGVLPNGIIAKGYGSTSPIADNETTEGRTANRRITLRWLRN